MNINQLLIKDLISAGNIKMLATFLKFKGFYSSSCIHNYKSISFVNKAKMSRNTIKKHIKFFIDNGWARIEGNNLVLNKFNSFDENKLKLIVSINKNKSIKEIELLLYRECLRLKQTQFRFNKQISSDLKNPTGLKQFKKAKSYCRKKGINTEKLPSAGDLYKVSIKKIACMFKCSVGKASQIIDKLTDANMIKKFRQMQILCFGMPNAINAQCLNYYSGSYHSRNQVVLRYTNRYKF